MFQIPVALAQSDYEGFQQIVTGVVGAASSTPSGVSLIQVAKYAAVGGVGSALGFLSLMLILGTVMRAYRYLRYGNSKLPQVKKQAEGSSNETP